METRTAGRGIAIATAVALGIVSLVTALGVLQASLWNDRASLLSADSADARDQSISIGVISQLQQRQDTSALLEARMLARRQDAAIEAGDLELAFELETDIASAVGTAFQLPAGAFTQWREAGFPDDERPTESPLYLVETRGGADALILTSQELGDQAKQLNGQAAIFGQAALVHALALFLFGVAGINRLRSARYVTLGMGAIVFVFGLFLMSTAY